MNAPVIPLDLAVDVGWHDWKTRLMADVDVRTWPPIVLAHSSFVAGFVSGLMAMGLPQADATMVAREAMTP